MRLKIGRRFLAHRVHDISGISGTGYVAEGIMFHDGQVVVSWFGDEHIVEVPMSLETWLKVHGHGGLTTIKWLDKKSLTTIPSSRGRKNASKRQTKKSTR